MVLYLVLGILVVIGLIIVLVYCQLPKNDEFYDSSTNNTEVEKIEPSEKNIFLVWVGKTPSKSQLNQIQKSILSIKSQNPDRPIFLFSNRISHILGAKVIKFSYDSLYKDSPLEGSKFRPYGETIPNSVNIKPALWSDLFRYIVLWKYGGSYIDCDDICIRPLPNLKNCMGASILESKEESNLYSGGIPSEFTQFNSSYNWRWGNDPILNMVPGNSFFFELMVNLAFENPEDWGQKLPTRIFKSHPKYWKDNINVVFWHDLLYHPKHDGHASSDKRYLGSKILWNQKATYKNLISLLTNYKFPLVKNHNWNQTSKPKRRRKKILSILLELCPKPDMYSLRVLQNSTDTIKQRLNLPIFYINIDKSLTRRLKMEFRTEKFGIKLKRITGVNGREVKWGGDKLAKDLDFKNSFSPGLFPSHYSRRELGCLLSHLLAIFTAYSMGLDAVLICEDDIDFSPWSFPGPDLKTIIGMAPKNWEILQLFSPFCEIKSKNKFFSRWRGDQKCYGAAAYVINRKGMKKFLPQNKTLFLSGRKLAADSYLYQKSISFVWLGNPLFLIDDNGHSSIVQGESSDDIIYANNKVRLNYGRTPPNWNEKP